MEQSQNINTKIISAIVVILLVLGVGYILLGKDRVPEGINQQVPVGNGNKKPVVVVENSPMVNGMLSVPAGFPQDVPLEKGSVLESTTIHYPEQNAEQLHVSYQSSRTVAQKFAEYRDYMTTSGYKVTESGSSTSGGVISGTKGGTNLSVVINSSEGGTLVKLSYLITLLSN